MSKPETPPSLPPSLPAPPSHTDEVGVDAHLLQLLQMMMAFFPPGSPQAKAIVGVGAELDRLVYTANHFRTKYGEELKRLRETPVDASLVEKTPAG